MNKDYLIGRLFDKMNKYDQAITHYKLSAINDNNVKSQFRLGCMFSINRNKECIKWYKMASNNGCVKSQIHLGTIYSYNSLAKKDYKEALKWFKMGAINDSEVCAFLIGNLYYKGGFGLEEDIKKSINWYEKSYINGHYWASTQLGKINNRYNNKDDALRWFQIAVSQGINGSKERLDEFKKSNE